MGSGGHPGERGQYVGTRLEYAGLDASDRASPTQRELLLPPISNGAGSGAAFAPPTWQQLQPPSASPLGPSDSALPRAAATPSPLFPLLSNSAQSGPAGLSRLAQENAASRFAHAIPIDSRGSPLFLGSVRSPPPGVARPEPRSGGVDGSLAPNGVAMGQLPFLAPIGTYLSQGDGATHGPQPPQQLLPQKHFAQPPGTAPSAIMRDGVQSGAVERAAMPASAVPPRAFHSAESVFAPESAPADNAGSRRGSMTAQSPSGAGPSSSSGEAPRRRKRSSVQLTQHRSNEKRRRSEMKRIVNDIRDQLPGEILEREDQNTILSAALKYIRQLEELLEKMGVPRSVIKAGNLEELVDRARRGSCSVVETATLSSLENDARRKPLQVATLMRTANAPSVASPASARPNTSSED